MEFLEKRPSRADDVSYFVTRTEFNAQREARDRQIFDLNATLLRIDAKLDKIIERELRNSALTKKD